MDILTAILLVLVAVAVYYFRRQITKAKIDIEYKELELHTIKSLRHSFAKRGAGSNSGTKMHHSQSIMAGGSSLELRGPRNNT